jgi:hypothetical protein
MSSSATSAINVSFNDAEFRFALETVLAGCHRHAADIGEVVMTACRITDGDPDSWLDEWIATGRRVVGRRAGRASGPPARGAHLLCRPRQFIVMKLNSRCSILFHFECPAETQTNHHAKDSKSG